MGDALTGISIAKTDDPVIGAILRQLAHHSDAILILYGTTPGGYIMISRSKGEVRTRNHGVAVADLSKPVMRSLMH
jgi:hypothetical protein